MATGASAQKWDQPSRRRRPRYRVHAPVDVTIFRSDTPDKLPGRSVNLGEGGIAAVLAGELAPGEPVGVEIRLKASAAPLRTGALVRNHDKLRSGLEFIGLSKEQESALHAWVKDSQSEIERDQRAPVSRRSDPSPSHLPVRGSDEWSRSAPQNRWRRLGIFAACFFFGLAGILLWRWNHSWRALESDIQKETYQTPQAHVPPDVMEKLVTHRVDPDYPTAARAQKLQGVILLDVVVGTDGSVIETRALNGPEILAQSAVEAMRWWKFEPYRVNGRDMVVETTVAVEFTP
jgi:TonB family protein